MSSPREGTSKAAGFQGFRGTLSRVTVYAGDIQIGVQNSTIKYGAQIVDFIRIRLTGVADNFGRDPQPVRCSPCMPYDDGAATCLILRLLFISWP